MSWPPQWRGAGVAESESAVTLSAAKGATRSTVEDPVLEKKTRSQDDVDLPWQVVVHRHMLEVHQKGRSILWSGMRERAELYVQQLHGYLLLATLEKVS